MRGHCPTITTVPLVKVICQHACSGFAPLSTNATELPSVTLPQQCTKIEAGCRLWSERGDRRAAKCEKIDAQNRSEWDEAQANLALARPSGATKSFKRSSRANRDKVAAADSTKHEPDTLFCRAPFSRPRGLYEISAQYGQRGSVDQDCSA